MSLAAARSESRIIFFLRHITSISCFFNETMKWTLVKPFQGKPLRFRAAITQMDEVGVKSIPIMGLVSFVIGIIMVLQTAYQLEKFGPSIMRRAWLPSRLPVRWPRF